MNDDSFAWDGDSTNRFDFARGSSAGEMSERASPPTSRRARSVPQNRGYDSSSQQQQHRPNKSHQQSSPTYQYQICLYIQMQLCTPITLADFIRTRPGNTTDKNLMVGAFAAFRQILLGLNHIHERNIIHRDLKPGNIFADSDGVFKVGDFGLSKLVETTGPNGAGNPPPSGGAAAPNYPGIRLQPLLTNGVSGATSDTSPFPKSPYR